MTDVVAVAFTPAPSSDSPNLKAQSNQKALTTFHNLIELCFASVRRWNPDLELVLVTTSDPGERLRTRFDELSVSILETTFDHRPPAGFYPTFNASLFSIDAMAALASNYAHDDRLALIDPDVVCTQSLEPLFASIAVDGFLAYDTQFPADEVSQGLSAREAGKLHKMLDPSLANVPRHYGGELYGFTPKSWDAIAGKVDSAWAFSLAQWQRDLPRFVTEEHVLNYALRHTIVRSADSFIRRIWTAPSHRTVRPHDARLPLWHLPAEKHRGLARLHSCLSQSDSWFWTDPVPAWHRNASRECGLGRRTTKRWLRDTAGSWARALQRATPAPQKLA